MLEKATFGAGCFWGLEESLRLQPGVISTRVGYTGGDFQDPTYEDVCRGSSNHVEAVEVTFDNSLLSYINLLEIFWSLHNPTTSFYKRQYQSSIFTNSTEQALEARKFKDSKEKFSSREITTVIETFVEFFPAEEKHQHYVQKRNDPDFTQSKL